jgi:hypothetical protein
MPSKSEICVWDTKIAPFVEVSDECVRLHFDLETRIQDAMESLADLIPAEAWYDLITLWGDDAKPRKFETKSGFVIVKNA